MNFSSGFFVPTFHITILTIYDANFKFSTFYRILKKGKKTAVKI